MEGVALAGVVASLASCDAGGPGVPEPTVLRGTVDVRDRLARTVAAADVRVRVTDADGRAVEVTTGSDGSWSAEHAGEGPYSVTAVKEGFGAPELTGVAPAASDLRIPVLQRSDARVREIQTARIHLPEGAEPFLELRFTVASDGVFPEDAGRQVFRIFLGEPGSVSPGDHDATMALIVPEDHPETEVDGDVLRIRLSAIRGLDLAALASRTLDVLLVGATENAVFGPGASAASGFADVAEVGATARVTR